MKKTLTTLLVLFIALTTFANDAVTLKNNMTFSGEVLRIKKNHIVFKANNEKYKIPHEDLSSVYLEDQNGRLYRKLLELEKRNEEAQPINKKMAAKFDASHFHGKKGSHFVLGFFFGPFSMIGTALASPSPYNGRHTQLLSKNKKLFNDPEYLIHYKRKAKGGLIVTEALGWATWLLILAL
ncbi:hypothetical protein EMN47_04615 [Prolixibacteraceae bacterium JC049]|nr:hypothetical protein [Prolixibacteraceae bacterium JC049]